MQLNHDVTMDPTTIGMDFTERTIMGPEPELSSTITTRITIFDQALQPIAMARAVPTVIPTSTVPTRRYAFLRLIAREPGQEASHPDQAVMAVIEEMGTNSGECRQASPS